MNCPTTNRFTSILDVFEGGTGNELPYYEQVYLNLDVFEGGTGNELPYYEQVYLNLDVFEGGTGNELPYYEQVYLNLDVFEGGTGNELPYYEQVYLNFRLDSPVGLELQFIITEYLITNPHFYQGLFSRNRVI